jgi:hypothetical protein
MPDPKQPEPKRDPKELDGAPSVVEQDQTSFEDDESRRGKHYAGGRKVIDRPHVGAQTPDTEAPSDVRERTRK